MLVDLYIVEVPVLDYHGGDRMRTLRYPGTCTAVICYSVDDSLSLESVESVWKPELAHYIPEAALILIGTKSDVGSRQVSIEEVSYP